MQLRAGVIFPVTRIQKKMKAKTKTVVRKDAAVMQDIVEQILYLGSCSTIADKRKRIKPRDLLVAFEDLNGLRRYMQPIIPGAGVLPIQQTLPAHLVSSLDTTKSLDKSAPADALDTNDPLDITDPLNTTPVDTNPGSDERGPATSGGSKDDFLKGPGHTRGQLSRQDMDNTSQKLNDLIKTVEKN